MEEDRGNEDNQNGIVPLNDTPRKSKEESVEDQLEKLPYPKSVFFIVSNEFCERFSFYGMRTILSIYLTDILLFQENTSKIIFHVFTFLVYFFPVFGAMIADSWLGKFKTILYISIIYAVGNILLALSATPPLNIPATEFSMIALVIIALGSGGIKPCVSAFGGDQFVLPQQELQLARFFSMFYFSINAGSLISTAVTPLLREDVHCFGQESCYTLAFGVPGVLMIISIVIFGFGKPLYKIREPQGNVVLKVSKCITNAIKTRSKSSVKKDHWLDYSEEKYGKQLVDDIKATMRVLVLYLPLPVFWALYDQQGTGWTFQARRMDGDIGFYTILPDQMQVVNPLLILIFIPLFQYVIYPTMNKFNFLTSPLKRLGTGGLLIGIAFIISACISLILESHYPRLPEKGEGQIRIYNNKNCNLLLTASELSKEDILIKPMEYYENLDVSVTGRKNIPYRYDCGSILGISGEFSIPEEKQVGFTFLDEKLVQFEDDTSKDNRGSPKVRVLANTNSTKFKLVDEEGIERVNTYLGDTSLNSLNIGKFSLRINDKTVKNDLQFNLGGVYVILLDVESANTEVHLKTVTPPNQVHMLWLIPQYIIITMGEIMFSITGLEFSYSQAPSSMKSVLQACWLLTTAFGNLIVVIIEAIDPFENQSANFFLYSGIIIVDILIFAMLAKRYKYVEKSEEESSDMDLKPINEGIDNKAYTKSKEDP